jgi:ABC-type nitrate/sulfonate/bicarbonate transport system substrate-binding protein
MNMHHQKSQNRLGSVIFLFVLALLFSGSAHGAEGTPERQLEKITIAYSSVSGNMAPLWITHDRGFFRKNGLDVQLVFIESGTTAVQSLSSKTWPSSRWPERECCRVVSEARTCS